MQGCRGRSPRQNKLLVSPFPAGEGGWGDRGQKRKQKARSAGDKAGKPPQRIPERQGQPVTSRVSSPNGHLHRRFSPCRLRLRRGDARGAALTVFAMRAPRARAPAVRRKNDRKRLHMSNAGSQGEGGPGEMELSVANATAAFEMVLSPGAGIASAAGKSALRARAGGYPSPPGTANIRRTEHSAQSPG